jgi:uncharacterized protein
MSKTILNMKHLIMTLFFVMSMLVMAAQSGNPNYDETLAKKLGADDYGMKRYVLVILKTGTNTTNDKEFISQHFAGHMSNMKRLSDEGKLVVAGPIGKNEHAYRGIFILNAATTDEARAMVDTDPAVKAGLLAVDLYPWYGSAALPVYLEAADKIWKQNP